MSKTEQQLQIEAKMVELKELCILHGVPMFATVAYQTENQPTKYKTEVYTPLQADVVLENDKITKFGAAISERFYVKLVGSEKCEFDNAEMYDSLLED